MAVEEFTPGPVPDEAVRIFAEYGLSSSRAAQDMAFDVADSLAGLMPGATHRYREDRAFLSAMRISGSYFYQSSIEAEPPAVQESYVSGDIAKAAVAIYVRELYPAEPQN